MKIVTTLFEYPDYPHQYKKLHAVLKESCKQNMPGVEFDTIRITGEYIVKGRHIGYSANTAKLTAQNRYIQAASDDIILIDADMMCIGPGYHAFDNDFDIAYTMRTCTRPGGPTINGGVMMIRNTPTAKEWFNALKTVNDYMYQNKDFHDQWNKKYPGMNQSAMGYMITNPNLIAKVHEYKTQEWNAVDCDWDNIDDSTVFVHCKGQLREAIEKNSGPASLAPLVKTWYDFLYETDYCSNDGQERGYVVKEIPDRSRRIRRPYTRNRYGKRRRHR